MRTCEIKVASAEATRYVQEDRVLLAGQNGVLRLTLSVSNPVRDRICEILNTHHYRYDCFEDLRNVIPGCTLVERRDPRTDAARNYRCAYHVFRKCLQEPWTIGGCFEDESEKEALWQDTFLFLARKGYALVTDDAPRIGDVAVYGNGMDDEGPYPSPRVEHFGIVQKPGVIESKLGIGDIIEHRIPDVDFCYGNDVVFVRKSQT